MTVLEFKLTKTNLENAARDEPDFSDNAPKLHLKVIFGFTYKPKRFSLSMMIVFVAAYPVSFLFVVFY